MAEADPAAVEGPRFFDGHNDTLLRLRLAAETDEPELGELARPFFEGREGHLDLPKARAGGLAGGLFAVFVPSRPRDLDDLTTVAGGGRGGRRRRVPRDQRPATSEVDHDQAARLTGEVVDLFDRMVAARPDAFRRLERVEELEQAEAACRDTDPASARAHPLWAVLHFEGAEAVAEDLSDLEPWRERGLRSLGPVWSRSNRFGHGVPFRFPSTPDHGDGLSASGRELVRACEELGILVDLSHLNERGFWDVQRAARRPLVVTHTGVLSLCASSRNLTDDQIWAVADSDGVVGVTLHCGDLRADGRLDGDTPVDIVVDHVEAVAELVGDRHVALGSDFDGALVPRELGDASALPKLASALRGRGWSEEALRRFAHGNWLRALRAAWE